VTDEDAAQHKAYGNYLAAVEEMLARTDAPHAPWVIVEATDRCFTRVKVMETLIHTLETRLGDKAPPSPPAPLSRRREAVGRGERGEGKRKPEAAHA
jgi:hypothetical protein